MWAVSDSKLITRPTSIESEGLKLVSEGCDLRKVCIYLFARSHETIVLLCRCL